MSKNKKEIEKLEPINLNQDRTKPIQYVESKYFKNLYFFKIFVNRCLFVKVALCELWKVQTKIWRNFPFSYNKSSFNQDV